MSNEMIGLVVFAVLIGGLALVCFVIVKVMDFHYKHNDKKHRREHPEFFRLYDEFDEKSTIACRFYNKEVAPLKRQVKRMLEDEPYWPREVREQKMGEIEALRCKIYTGECMAKGLDKDTQEARAKVADYVHTHNIKWAGVWE